MNSLEITYLDITEWVTIEIQEKQKENKSKENYFIMNQKLKLLKADEYERFLLKSGVCLYSSYQKLIHSSVWQMFMGTP